MDGWISDPGDEVVNIVGLVVGFWLLGFFFVFFPFRFINVYVTTIGGFEAGEGYD